MKDACEVIHRASIEVLEEAGIHCPDDHTLSLLNKNGIKTSGDQAFFTEAQIMTWLKRAPGTFIVYARNPDYNLRIGGGCSWFAPGYGAPMIVDFDGKKRRALFDDYITFIKLVQQCSLFHINGGLLVQPSDLSEKSGFPLMLFAAMELSDKCLISGAGGAEEANIVMNMLKIVFNDMSRPRIFALVSTSSPLGISQKSLETIRIFAESGQPVIISPAPMAGMTGPVTIAGHLAMANAEALAGIVITQMFHPGTPVIYGVQGCNADMRNAVPCAGSPDSALIVSHCAEMARYYGLPSRSGGTKNDAKSVDIQSGYESMMMMMASCQSGIDLIIHSAGILDTFMSMSYEKFIVDTEMIGMVKHFMKGVAITDETLAVKTIKETGSHGDFLTNAHTLKHCAAAHYKADIGIRRMLNDGETSRERLLLSINEKKNRMLDEYVKPPFEKLTRKTLYRYLADLGAEEEMMIW